MRGTTGSLFLTFNGCLCLQNETQIFDYSLQGGLAPILLSCGSFPCSLGYIRTSLLSVGHPHMLLPLLLLLPWKFLSQILPCLSAAHSLGLSSNAISFQKPLAFILCIVQAPSSLPCPSYLFSLFLLVIIFYFSKCIAVLAFLFTYLASISPRIRVLGEQRPCLSSLPLRAAQRMVPGTWYRLWYLLSESMGCLGSGINISK